MPSCVVVGCHEIGGKGKSFFCFPQDPQIKNSWIKRINRSNWMPSSHSKVCWKHFQDTDFAIPQAVFLGVPSHFRPNRRLKVGAIPSLQLRPTTTPQPSTPQHYTPQRSTPQPSSSATRGDGLYNPVLDHM